VIFEKNRRGELWYLEMIAFFRIRNFPLRFTANDGTESPTPPGQHDELIPTRWSLLNRLKDCKTSEAGRIFRYILEADLRVARKAGLSDAEAQDVVQRTVISVAKKMASSSAIRRRDHSSLAAEPDRWRILNS